jgi:hypothetical protein
MNSRGSAGSCAQVPSGGSPPVRPGELPGFLGGSLREPGRSIQLRIRPPAALVDEPNLARPCLEGQE